MIHLPNSSSTKTAVYGLGISGLASIKAIQRSGGQAIAWDDKDLAREKAQIALGQHGCQFKSPTEYNWDEISALILSPGIPTTFPSPHWVVELARRHQCPIKCDIELFLEVIHEMRKSSSSSSSSSPAPTRPKVIGVTGTNGKSTTTALIGFILNQLGIDSEVGGNIGIPVLDLSATKKVYVLELSSFQIELLSSTIMNSVIDIAVLLNLTPDHIDRHGTFENYIQVKERLLANAKEVAVVCTDTEETLGAYDRLFQRLVNTKCTVKQVSTKALTKTGACLIGSELSIRMNDEGNVLTYQLHQPEMKINLGVNAQNIASAFTVITSLLPDFFSTSDRVEKYDKIIEAVKIFPGLPHRAELVGSVGNIEFVNDSKSTNADSSEQTLLVFDNIFWVLGGQQKGEEGINSLVKNWKASLCKIKKIFLIGESTEEFAKCLIINTQLEFVKCGDMKNAFQMAVQEAQKSTTSATCTSQRITILLSPACASFDQWKNFEERGDAFRSLALEYIEQHKDMEKFTS